MGRVARRGPSMIASGSHGRETHQLPNKLMQPTPRNRPCFGLLACRGRRAAGGCRYVLGCAMEGIALPHMKAYAFSRRYD